MQREIAALSRQSRQVIATESEHSIQDDQPESVRRNRAVGGAGARRRGAHLVMATYQEMPLPPQSGAVQRVDGTSPGKS